MKNKYIFIAVAVMVFTVVFAFAGYYVNYGSGSNDYNNHDFNPQNKILYYTTNYLPVINLDIARKYDLNGNGIQEEIVLNNGRLEIYSGSLLLWSSPDNWWIDFFLPGDSDNDGAPELNMVVWKKGSFGPVKPFWVDEDDKSIKCHLFIFRLKGHKVSPVWMSSNLPHPIYRAELNDTNEDGENELIVKAGSYQDPGKIETIIWKWDEWGFTR